MHRHCRGVFLGSALGLLLGCGGSSPEGAPAPQERQTGAVEILPESTLAGQHVESIVELLRGRVAGLEVIELPNGDISLKIRGGDPSPMESAEPREPLVVVDGMSVTPGNVSRVLRSLRPHEIDNIQVLKDVASTSVYGIRGAHGVIIITTKRD